MQLSYDQYIMFPKTWAKMPQNTFFDILKKRNIGNEEMINFVDSLKVTTSYGLSTDFQNNKD
jgi:hypothetical protein